MYVEILHELMDLIDELRLVGISPILRHRESHMNNA